MAPVVVAPEVSSTTTALEQLKIVAKETVAAAPGEATYPREPLKLAGVLDKYEQFDVTPVLGREFPTIQIREVLNAPNADELIRDIAITVSQRNVVFFRKQELTNLELKTFVQKLGELTGKPKESGLVS